MLLCQICVYKSVYQSPKERVGDIFYLIMTFIACNYDSASQNYYYLTFTTLMSSLQELHVRVLPDDPDVLS